MESHLQKLGKLHFKLKGLQSNLLDSRIIIMKIYI